MRFGELALFAVPVAALLIWWLSARIASRRVLAAAILALLGVMAAVVILALDRHLGAGPYVPAHLENGVVVPGHASTIVPGHASTIVPGHASTIVPGHASTIVPGHASTIVPGHASTIVPGHAATEPDHAAQR